MLAECDAHLRIVFATANFDPTTDFELIDATDCDPVICGYRT